MIKMAPSTGCGGSLSWTRPSAIVADLAHFQICGLAIDRESLWCGLIWGIYRDRNGASPKRSRDLGKRCLPLIADTLPATVRAQIENHVSRVAQDDVLQSCRTVDKDSQCEWLGRWSQLKPAPDHQDAGNNWSTQLQMPTWMPTPQFADRFHDAEKKSRRAEAQYDEENIENMPDERELRKRLCAEHKQKQQSCGK